MTRGWSRDVWVPLLTLMWYSGHDATTCAPLLSSTCAEVERLDV